MVYLKYRIALMSFSFPILVVIILGFTMPNYAQSTIKAQSPKISIKDGNEGKTRFWNHLVKSKTPIEYHLAKSQQERRVVFYTDIDSIAFHVSSESAYNFNVILNEKDTCVVSLTTKTYPYSKINNNTFEIDTLPFTVNKNKQIIIKGSINRSPDINFCFDLGAKTVYVIGKDLDKKNNIIVDGLMEDESVTGLATEKTSSQNSLQLGNLNIGNLPICYIDEAGFLENGGGLIGFNVFQNQILEIDFDKQLLLIHKKLPVKAKEYASIDFKQTTGGLYIPITINNGKKESTGWYFFDTGADNALAFDLKFAKKENLNNTMKTIGNAGITSSENRLVKAVVLEVPKVQIANFTIDNVPTILAEESNTEADFEDGVIGIGLQKRFNIIIDYPNSKMYLKPNKYFSESFKKKGEMPSSLIIGFSIALGLLVVGFFIYKKKNKLKY